MELLLITSYYPYNYGDMVFIKPEIPYLLECFNKIHVLPTIDKALHYEKMDISPNIRLIPFSTYCSKSKLILYVFISIFHPFKILYLFFVELIYLHKRRNLSFDTIKKALTYLLNANYVAVFLKKYLSLNPEIKIVYTYWYKMETLSSIIIKRLFSSRVKCITRAHGGDIYEFRQKNNYQPYKNWINKHIDLISFASYAGYNYYLELFGNVLKHKYIVSRLGKEIDDTLRVIRFSDSHTRGQLKIVSCSYIVPVKHIEAIVNALAKIDDIIVEWTHIGNGEDRGKISMLAKELLFHKKNINYFFAGHMENAEILKFYSEHYFDCFISTSKSEGGVPVSMMEAISFGIPIIATNVGGVPEIVNTDTGILLDFDNCIEELISALRKFSNMSNANTSNLRQSCRNFWESNFNAKKQYPIFIERLKGLV